MSSYVSLVGVAFEPMTNPYAIQVRSESTLAIRAEIEERWPEIHSAVDQLIKSRRTENTRAAYANDWLKWCMWVIAKATDLKMPGLAATAEFRDELTTRYESASVRRILTTLSFLYSALREAGHIRVNPFARAWLPRPEASALHKTPTVADSDALRLVRHVEADRSREGQRDALIIRLLYETGLRRASVAGLRRDQFRREEDGLVVLVKLKGGKEGIVKIQPDTERALSAWLAVAYKSPFVFPKRGKPSEPMALASVNHILKERAKQAGITEIVAPHRFRAAFITTAIDAGTPIRDVQVAAHHTSVDTTSGYDRGARGMDVFDVVAAHRKQRQQEREEVESAPAPAPAQPESKYRRPVARGTFAELQDRARMLSCGHCGAESDQACDGLVTHRARILVAMTILDDEYREDRYTFPPELVRAHQSARSAGTPAKLTAKQWRLTREHFSDRCAYCGEPWSCIEHATPITRGGGTTVANCLPSCTSCNSRKRTMTIEELAGKQPAKRSRIEFALAWLQKHGRPVVELGPIGTRGGPTAVNIAKFRKGRS
jgi:integrase/recombinase XerD